MMLCSLIILQKMPLTMQSNFNTIIADTSCLILLSKINRLNILNKMFGTVSITKIVADEFSEFLPDYIQVVNNINDKSIEILKLSLDIGEASSIALALEIDNSLLIIDDLKGRKLCESLKINFSGSIGLLIKALREKIIEDPIELLKDIKATNFRISDSILKLLSTINPDNI